MRYLLYYPMIHIFSEDYLRNIVGKGLKNNQNKEQLCQDLEGAIVETKENIDVEWHKLIDYLQKKEPFDRVYLEGSIETKDPISYPQQTSGMYDCLNYLAETKARFEKTNSDFTNNLGEKIHAYESKVLEITKGKPFISGFFINPPNNFIDWLREIEAVSSIDKSLKEGEKGILLFGAGHLEGITTELKNFKGTYDLFEESV